ncbi:MAG TPA: uracil phosphoribosyltransferase [Actinomycetota bacterium]|nr:uracil phosphoribosyltransferase [Actinomycetota bacterium]
MRLLPQNDQLRALHTAIRDRDATREDFVHYSRRIIRLLLEEAMNLLPFEEKKVTTPVGETYAGLAFASPLCGVSVLRAGESMEAELRAMHPGIRIGKILIQRDRSTKLPRLYFASLPPDVASCHVLLLEPMLATGGSALAALDVLARAGVSIERIVLVAFLASPQALGAITTAHPALNVVTSAVEDGLDENAYMLPGIGDFGDRYFGTQDTGAR